MVTGVAALVGLNTFALALGSVAGPRYEINWCRTGWASSRCDASGPLNPLVAFQCRRVSASSWVPVGSANTGMASSLTDTAFERGQRLLTVVDPGLFVTDDSRPPMLVAEVIRCRCAISPSPQWPRVSVARVSLNLDPAFSVGVGYRIRRDRVGNLDAWWDLSSVWVSGSVDGAQVGC